MSIIHTISKLLLNKTGSKLSKQRVDYLLSALALSALSNQALAADNEKGYEIDVSQLAKAQGVEINDISKVEITLSDPSQGEIIALGNGVFQFVPAKEASDVSFMVSGDGIANSFTSSFSAAAEVSLQENFAKSWNDFIDSLSATDSAATSKIDVDFDMSALGLGILALAAGGSGGAGSGGAANVLATLSGVASHGTLENARVFLDLDGDSVWDANEVYDITDDQGQYDLSDISAADQANGTLVVRALSNETIDGVTYTTTDAISGSNVENLVMKAQASATVITPLTTLVEAGLSNDDVIDILGLDATNIDINTFNPFSTADAGTANAIAFEKVASQIFTTVNTIAEAIDTAAGADITVDTAFSLAIAEVVKQVETEVQVRTDNATTQTEADALTEQKSALEAEEVLLQAIVDAAAPGDDTTTAQAALDAKALEVTNKALEVTNKTTEATTDKVSDVVTTLTANVAKAVANVNTQIDNLTAFDATAKDTLNVGAEKLAEQVAANIADPTKAITLAADTLITTNEDAIAAARTFKVVGTSSTSAVDANGVYGNLTHDSGSNWVYTPHVTNDHGQALNSMEVYDETFVITEGGATYSVTVVVVGRNDDPVIDNTTTAVGSITEDSSTTTATGTIVASDFDNAGDITDVLTYGAATLNGTYGSLTINSTSGDWTYTLDNSSAVTSALSAGEVVTDTITITVTDSYNATVNKDVVVTITGANDAPVITSSATISTPENGLAVSTITTTDAESDSIAYSISGTDSALFAIDVSTGVLTFVAAPDFEGESPAHGATHSNEYSLTVTANDGAIDETKALTVTVTNVEGAPVFSSAEITAVDENQTTVITLTASDDENDNIAFTISGTDADAFDLSSGGILTFKSAPNYEVKTSYSLTVTASETTDKVGGAITTPNTTDQELTVNINDINDAAVISAANDTITEGVATATGAATHTDADADNADNIFTAVTGQTATYGTYAVTAAGVWTYTLNNANATIDALGLGQSATDTITVTAQDDTTKDVTITIDGANDAASISGVITGAVTEDSVTTTATGTVTHTDVDANNTDNVFTAATSTTSIGGYGSYAVTTGGAWTYTLDNTNATVTALAAAATLDDTFAITAEDGTSQTITVTITGANDKPTVVADAVTISESDNATTSTVISVLSNDSDDEGTTLTVASKTDGSNGTVTDNGDGTVSYTPNANFNGVDTFQYRATDGTDQSELSTVTVTVDAVNDSPDGTVTITGDAKTGQTLTASNDLTDADGMGTVSYQWAKDGVDVSGATNSTLALSDSDIGSVYTVTASYTDSGNTAESVSSSATGTVTDIDKPFMFTSEIIKASAAPDGAYALNPNEDIIKLTLNVDMARTTDASVDSILGGVLDFGIDWSKIEAIQYDDSTSEAYRYTREAISDSAVDIDLTTFLGLTDSDSTADQFDTITIISLYTDTSNSPVLTLVDNVDTAGRSKVEHASSNDVAVIYLNPVDTETSLDITYGGAVQINQGDDADITQLSYTTTIDIL